MTFNRKLALAVLLVLTICTSAFIFHNSITKSEESNSTSDSVGEVIKPAAQPIFDSIEKSPSKDGLSSFFGFTSYESFIRKSAHVFEFALLGAVLLLLMYVIKQKLLCELLFMPLFLSMSCAVADEFIQSYGDRTSLVRDVVVDFCGALCGIAFAMILIAVIRLFAGKRKGKMHAAGRRRSRQ